MYEQIVVDIVFKIQVSSFDQFDWKLIVIWFDLFD